MKSIKFRCFLILLAVVALVASTGSNFGARSSTSECVAKCNADRGPCTDECKADQDTCNDGCLELPLEVQGECEDACKAVKSACTSTCIDLSQECKAACPRGQSESPTEPLP